MRWPCSLGRGQPLHRRAPSEQIDTLQPKCTAATRPHSAPPFGYDRARQAIILSIRSQAPLLRARGGPCTAQAHGKTLQRARRLASACGAWRGSNEPSNTGFDGPDLRKETPRLRSRHFGNLRRRVALHRYRPDRLAGSLSGLDRERTTVYRPRSHPLQELDRNLE